MRGWAGKNATELFPARLLTLAQQCALSLARPEKGDPVMKTFARAAMLAVSTALVVSACGTTSETNTQNGASDTASSSQEAQGGNITITDYREGTEALIDEFLATVAEGQATRVEVTGTSDAGTLKDIYSYNPDGSFTSTVSENGQVSGTIACTTEGQCYYKLADGPWQEDDSLGTEAPEPRTALTQYVNLLDALTTEYTRDDDTYTALLTQGEDTVTLTTSYTDGELTIAQEGSTSFRLDTVVTAAEPTSVNAEQMARQAQQEQENTGSEDTPGDVSEDTGRETVQDEQSEETQDTTGQ